MTSTVSLDLIRTGLNDRAKFEVEVVAAHFLYLAKLLLTAHDPTIPRMGPQMKSALAEMNVSNQSIRLTITTQH